MRYVVAAAVTLMVGINGAQGAAITTLVSFTGTVGVSAGSDPEAALVMDVNGNLYGTTTSGGKVAGNTAVGTVFEMVRSGSSYVYKNLVTFNNQTVAAGRTPFGGVTVDAAGNVYGTTAYGGGPGNGNVFKLTNNGTSYALSTIGSFGGSTTGSSPIGPLLADGSGNLFGTTDGGGSTGYGTAFELVKSGSSYVLRTLATLSAALGGNLFSGLIADSAGNLFGTSNDAGPGGYGTVFELVKGSSGYTVSLLASFNGSNGARPYAGLTLDANGNLFGTTTYGGANNAGLVFELVKGGTGYTLKTLASFGGAAGSVPDGALIADYDGNFYGTTTTGGASSMGTVFELARGPVGYTFNTLITFNGTGNGATPYGGLIADGAGNLFGTTSAGGASGKGTVFELTGTGFVTGASLQVPEPGTLVLVAGALVAAIGSRRRRVG